MAAENEGGVRVLNRALDILECLAGQTNGLPLTDISEKCGLSPSTAHRILKVFEQREYLSRDEDSKRYTFGPKTRYFSALAKNEPFDEIEFLRENSQESLDYLQNSFGETASIYILDGDSRVCIERKESEHSLRFTVQIGSRFPISTGGAGKVLMSGMEDSKLKEILGDKYDSVIEDVKKCRKPGYWVSNGERAVGVVAIGVPIYNADGRIIATISYSGPTVRMLDEHLPEKVTAVLEEGKKLSRKMGYYPADSFI